MSKFNVSNYPQEESLSDTLRMGARLSDYSSSKDMYNRLAAKASVLEARIKELEQELKELKK